MTVMDNLDSSRPVRRLGFKEIVPGHAGPATEDKGRQGEIPQFDLAHQIMANQRRVVGATRKGPGAKSPIPAPAVPRPVRKAEDSVLVCHQAMTDQHRLVIARIVSRDIERLCRGERVFGP